MKQPAAALSCCDRTQNRMKIFSKKKKKNSLHFVVQTNLLVSSLRRRRRRTKLKSYLVVLLLQIDLSTQKIIINNMRYNIFHYFIICKRQLATPETYSCCCRTKMNRQKKQATYIHTILQWQ